MPDDPGGSGVIPLAGDSGKHEPPEGPPPPGATPPANESGDPEASASLAGMTMPEAEEGDLSTGDITGSGVGMTAVTDGSLFVGDTAVEPADVMALPFAGDPDANPALRPNLFVGGAALVAGLALLAGLGIIIFGLQMGIGGPP